MRVFTVYENKTKKRIMAKPSKLTIFVGGAFALATSAILLDDALHNDEKEAICSARQNEILTSFNTDQLDIDTSAHSGDGDMEIVVRYTLSAEESPHWAPTPNNRRCEGLTLTR